MNHTEWCNAGSLWHLSPQPPLVRQQPDLPASHVVSRLAVHKPDL